MPVETIEIEGRKVQALTTGNRKTWLKHRAGNLNSTDTPQLFGASPYGTYMDLWAEKKGIVGDRFVPSERTEMGRTLEPAIARYVSKAIGSQVLKVRQYLYDEAEHIGSSFDYEILDPANINGVGVAPQDGVNWLLEIKNVDFLVYRDKWIEEQGELVEAPPHIEIQCQHQAEMAGRPGVVLAVLVAGNDLKLLAIPRDTDMGATIRESVRGFWDVLGSVDKMPEADLERDAAIMAEVYRNSAPGWQLNTDDETIANLLHLHYQSGQAKARAQAMQDAAKTRLLEIIQRHERVMTPSYVLHAKTVAAKLPETVTVTQEMVGTEIQTSSGRREFRGFRVNPRNKPTTTEE